MAKNYRVPSVKALLEHKLVNDRAEALKLRAHLYFDEVEQANEVLDMCGLETIPWPRQAFNNCQMPSHTLRYFNAGDTYNTTILSIDGKGWFIGCWGDSFEQMERRWGKGGE